MLACQTTLQSAGRLAFPRLAHLQRSVSEKKMLVKNNPVFFAGSRKHEASSPTSKMLFAPASENNTLALHVVEQL
jgi:hypothetical protein